MLSIKISPLSASISFAISDNIVLLPLPDFPTKATVVFDPILKDKSLKIGSFLTLSIGFLFLNGNSSFFSFSRLRF